MLLVVACSTNKEHKDYNELPGDLPKWVFAPYEECSEVEEICANGEASESQTAETQAKANLASIFETRIKSELFEVSNTNVSNQRPDSFYTDVTVSINQSVDQLLELVQIKKKFKKDGIVYALASMDKKQASELLEKRIHKLDIKFLNLWRKKQRTSFNQMNKLYLEREKLNERLIIFNRSLPLSVKWEDVLEWKNNFTETEPIQLRIGVAPDWIHTNLVQQLTEAGFEVVQSSADKILKVDFSAIKEFMNVNGFEKYTFTLVLSHIHNGRQLSSITAAESVVGKSQADSLLKVKEFFINHISENLSNLRLD